MANIPVWLDPSDPAYQQSLIDLSNRVIQLENIGSIGTDAIDEMEEGLIANTTTGIISQGTTTVGYLYRYLHVRFASDANGTTIVPDPTTFTGDILYVGLHNSASRTLADNAAFVFQAFTWQSTFEMFYRATGGRQIDLAADTGRPTVNHVLIPSNGFIIDLDDIGARGEAGAAGSTPIAYYSANSLDSRPTTLPPSTEWVVAADLDADTTYNWIVWGNTGGDGQPSIYDFTFSGRTGQRVMAAGAQAETGTITVRDDLNTGSGTVAVSEEVELEITPETVIGMVDGWRISAVTGATLGTLRITTAGVGLFRNFQNTQANWTTQIFRDLLTMDTSITNLLNIGDYDADSDSFVISRTAAGAGVTTIQFHNTSGFGGPELTINGTDFNIPAGNTGTGPLASQMIADPSQDIAGGTGSSEMVFRASAAPFTVTHNTAFSWGFDLGDAGAALDGTGNISFPDTSSGVFSDITISGLSGITGTMTAAQFVTAISPLLPSGTSFGAQVTAVTSVGNVLVFSGTSTGSNGYQGSFTTTENINLGRSNGPAPFSNAGAPDTITIGTAINNVPSQIRIQETALMIDETLTLEPSLTTQLAIEQDFRTKFNANANLRMHFNEMAAVTADDHPTIVYSTGGVRADTALTVTEIDNSGSLGLMETVTVQGADGTYVQGVVGFTYDGGVTNVMFGQNQDANAVASTIATMLNGLTQYTATAADNVVTFTRTTTGVLASTFTRSIVTAGSPMFTLADFALSVTAGSNMRFAGEDGSYELTIGTTDLSGALSNLTTEAMVDTIRGVINNNAQFFAEEITSVQLRATASESRVVPLTLTITPGSIYDPDTDMTTAATASVLRTVVDAGTDPAFLGNTISRLRGEPGAQGPYRLDIFRRSATLPAEPTGGTIQTAPTGWSFTVPMGTDQVYNAFVIINPVTDTTTTDLGTRWSAPFIAGGTGPAGSDGIGSQVRIIYHNNARNSQPSLPTSAGLVDNGWSIVPATNSNWFAQQVNTTSADGTTVSTFGDWRGPNLITGADGVNPTVTDNMNGTYDIRDGNGNTVTVNDGNDGDNLNIIFRRSTTVPSTPDPSPGVPADWFDDIDDVPDGAGIIYASFGMQAQSMGNFTWQAPVQVEGQDGADGRDGVNPTITMNADGSFTITDGDGNTATIQDGEDGAVGATGVSTNIIFRRSDGQPATPAASAGVPNDWFDTVENVPDGDGIIYGAVGNRGVGATVFTWNTPVPFQATDGLTNAQLTIYQRVPAGGTVPTVAPTGGTYSFATGAIVAPTGWTSAIPTGSGAIYASTATVAARQNTGTVTPTWSVPELAFQSGGQGPAGPQGAAGDNGMSSRLDVAFADNRDGTGNSRYPTGRIVSDNYTGATPVASNDYTGYNLVTWDAGETEPNVSTTPSDYSWQDTRGRQGVDGQRTQIFGVRAELTNAPFTPMTVVFSNYTLTNNLISGNRIWNATATLNNARTNFSVGPATYRINWDESTITNDSNISRPTAVVLGGVNRGNGVATANRVSEVNDAITVASTSFTLGRFLELNPGVTGTLTSGLNFESAAPRTEGLSDSDIEALFVANNLRGYTSSITGDTLFVDAPNGLSTAYVAQGNRTWQEQTGGFIDGNLLVSGTINADRLVANSITAAQLSATALDAVEISADRITTGTLDADRLNIDGLTIDTNDAGQLTVTADGTTGLAIIGGHLAANTDNTTTFVNDNGEIEAAQVVPVDAAFTGGVSGVTGASRGLGSTVTGLSGEQWLALRIDIPTISQIADPGDVIGLRFSGLQFRSEHAGSASANSRFTSGVYYRFSERPDAFQNTSIEYELDGGFIRASTRSLNRVDTYGTNNIFFPANSSTSQRYLLVYVRRQWTPETIGASFVPGFVRTSLVSAPNAVLTIRHTGSNTPTTRALNDYNVFANPPIVL